MGASSSRQVRPEKEPQEIGEFRNMDGPLDFFVIPEVPEKRKVTDFNFTITLAFFLILLFPFLIYSFVQSDLDRLTHGYDKCGNVCGENNSNVEGITCSGRDMTKLPFLKYREEDDTYYGDRTERKIEYDCAGSCDSNEYTIVMNRCFPIKSQDINEFFIDIGDDLRKSAGYIVPLCFIGFALSVGMLFLYRYFVAVVVWVILIGSLTALFVVTGVLWYYYSNQKSSQGLLYASIFFSVFSVGLLIMLLCMFKRIKLIIRLFKEAIKIIFGIPLILFEPLLTLVAGVIIFVIFAFFLVVWSSAGNLQLTANGVYDYVPNSATVFTMCFHSIMCLWILQFIVGCQHMVISGAVSSYYFARDKSALVSPIYNSFYNLVKYHLGTVAFGSLIITVVTIIKATLRKMANNAQTRILVECCLGAIEDFVKYLSKNAYILTAMHGQPFFKSGKRAVRLLAANAISTIALNSVGDFVLNMTKVLIVLCTVGIGFLMRDSSIKYFDVAIVVSAILTAIIADCFFSVFETTVDTIYLCFCEDSCMNNGVERPYYMTTSLMQYMDDAKKTIPEKNRN